MADDDVIKKIARLLNEGLDDRDRFGEVINTPSQILSQVFYDSNRYRRHQKPWDWSQPLEAALGALDATIAVLDPDGIEIPPEAIAAAEQIIKARYEKWQALGYWPFGEEDMGPSPGTGV